MKNILLFICFSVFLNIHSSNNNYIIEGHIEGLPLGTLVSLYESNTYWHSLNFGENAISSSLVDGHFRIEGKTTLSVMKSLSLDITFGKLTIPIQRSQKGKSSSNRFWLQFHHPDIPFLGILLSISPGTKIMIEGSFKKQSHEWKIRSNKKEQDECNIFTAKYHDLIKQRIGLKHNEDSLLELQRDKDETIRISIWDRIDSLRKKINQVNHLLYNTKIEHIKENPKSDFSIYLLNSLFYDRMSDFNFRYSSQIKELAANLTGKQLKTYEGQSITFLQHRNLTRPGEKITSDDLFDIQGKKYNFSDFEGKYILLDFHSKETPPCIIHPEMNEIVKRNSHNLILVSLNKDTTHTEWNNTIEKYDMKDIISIGDMKGNKGVIQYFALQAYPQYFLISPEGILLQTWMGFRGNKTIEQIENALRSKDTSEIFK